MSQRKNIKGWWTGWYEGGKRKAKALPTKALAEHFRHIKYTQLNSDVFTSVVAFDWRHTVQEYVQSKQVEGCKDASIYEIRLTLRHFERLVGCDSSKEITQPNLDTFVLTRGEEVGKSTLNKDITNLRAFLKWAVRNRFVPSGLEIRKVKVPQKPVVALSAEQVRDLLTTASRYPTLRLRVLLAVTTGLRRGDIEAIRVGDIHFDRNTILTRNRKARKAMPERPVPEAIMTELANHVTGLGDVPVNQRWDQREAAKFTANTRPRELGCETGVAVFRSCPCNWEKRVSGLHSKDWQTRYCQDP